MADRRPRIWRVPVLLLGVAALALAACASVGTAPDDAALADGGEDAVARVAGADRFATAAELAAGVDGDTLWVATGFEFADALAAAATGAGPVVLAERDTVPEATADVVAGFDGEVVAVGGGNALSDDVVDELGARRVAGEDRFATAAQIAAETHPEGAETAYLATGWEFADALTAAPAAAESDAPMLLAGTDELPAATAQALADLAPDEVVAVGGSAVLSDDVVDAAAEAAGGAATERVPGADRYETAAQVSAHRDLDDPELAYLATGEAFADALAAAPAAAADSAALLLTTPHELHEATAGELERLGVERVRVAGGAAAVSDAAVNAVRELLGVPVAPAGEKTVSFFDVGQADATLVETDDAAVLVDAGHWQRDDVADHLTAVGVEALDVLVLTHWHADHIGQVPEVLEAVDVDQVWTQPGEYDSATYDAAVAAIEGSDATVVEPGKGESYTVGDLTIDVVGPGPTADTGDVHDANLSVRTSFDGQAGVLFTGDAEAQTEARYVDQVPELLAADVYQVGHHGSSTSTTQGLLNAAAPEIAVYSAGAGNPYGHPHAEVLDRLTAAGVDLYGTDVHGTVTATWDGADWTVATETTGTPAPGDPDAGNGNGELTCVDLNTASADELTEIIHIGDTRAQAIIDGRPWSSVDELTQIDGIGDARLDDITDQGLAAVNC